MESLPCRAGDASAMAQHTAQAAGIQAKAGSRIAFPGPTDYPMRWRDDPAAHP